MEKRYYIVKSLAFAKELKERGFDFDTQTRDNEERYIFEDSTELRETILELSNLKKKYYVIKSRNLAMGLKWLGFEYYVFDSKEHEGEQVYSFERTPKFENTMKLLNSIKYE